MQSILFQASSLLLVCLTLCVGWHTSVQAQTNSNEIVGFWLTQDHDGIVEIYQCANEICGRFRWLKYDVAQGVPRDDKNPDATQHERPLCHMQFMGGFVRDEGQGYSNGWIYNPEDGQRYSANMKLTNHETLSLHGYVVLPLFGSSQIWTRTASSPVCREDGT